MFCELAAAQVHVTSITLLEVVSRLIALNWLEPPQLVIATVPSSFAILRITCPVTIPGFPVERQTTIASPSQGSPLAAPSEGTDRIEGRTENGSSTDLHCQSAQSLICVLG